MQAVREESTVEHPGFLHGFAWMDPLLHPVLKPVIDGEGTLGWEGDGRLAFYLGEFGRVYLYRLEWNGEYGLVCRSQPFEVLNPAGINRMIQDLISKDARRGFNAAQAVLDHNAQLEKAREQAFDEKVHEGSDRIVHWLGRAYLPGFDVVMKWR